MTGTASLHRYCPDHEPARALCGVDISGLELVADCEVDAAAETMPWCVVCADLSEQACSDACLAYSREASK